MKVVTLHEFQRRYLRSLQAEGLKLHPPSELHRFFESINRVYGREHEVLSLKYDVSRGGSTTSRPTGAWASPTIWGMSPS